MTGPERHVLGEAMEELAAILNVMEARLGQEDVPGFVNLVHEADVVWNYFKAYADGEDARTQALAAMLNLSQGMTHDGYRKDSAEASSG